MKKILFLLVTFLLLLTSCGDSKSGPFCIINKTEKDLKVLVSAKTYEDLTYEIESGERIDTGIYYYTPEIKVVNNFDDKSESKSYRTMADTAFDISIHRIQESDFSVINRIPADVFNGDDKLYFYEKDGKDSEYSNAITRKEINASTENFVITCFAPSPNFVLESENSSGEKIVGKCNGYSVVVKREGDIVYLY